MTDENMKYYLEWYSFWQEWKLPLCTQSDWASQAKRRPGDSTGEPCAGMTHECSCRKRLHPVMKFRWRVSGRNHLCSWRQQGRDLLIVRVTQPQRKPISRLKQKDYIILLNFGGAYTSIFKHLSSFPFSGYIPFHKPTTSQAHDQPYYHY